MKLCCVVCAFLLFCVVTAAVETWRGCGIWKWSKCSNAECVKTAEQAVKHVTGMLVAGYYKHIVFYCAINFTLQGISHFKCDVENDILQPTGDFPTCRPLNKSLDACSRTAEKMESNSSTDAINSLSMENSTQTLRFKNNLLLYVFILISVAMFCLILYTVRLRRLLRKREGQLCYFKTLDTANSNSNDRPDVLQLVPLKPKQPSSKVVYEYPTIENVVNKFEQTKRDRPKLRTPSVEKEEYDYATTSSFNCYKSAEQRDSDSSTETPIDDVDSDSASSQTIHVPINLRPRLKTPVEEIEIPVATALNGEDDEELPPVKLSPMNNYDVLSHELRNEMSQQEDQQSDNESHGTCLFVVNGDYDEI